MSRSIQHRERGFGLIEILVSMTLGMLAVIFMTQVYTASEGHKRTTTGGNDAQNNAAIALYSLEGDLRQAGYGANAYSVIGCNVTLRSGVTASNFGPVVINHSSIPAGDANTDTLLVFYGSSNDAPEGDRIAGQAAQSTYTLAAFTAASGVAPSFIVGQRVIAQGPTRPSPCGVTMETVTATSADTVSVATGLASATNGALYNLGTAPRVVAYAVRGGNLTMCDYMVNNCGGTYNAAHWVPIASNIVSLRAEYGRDTASGAMDGVIDAFDQTTPTNACQWLRMRAVRIALVARSAQLEPPNSATPTPTTTAPTWAGTATTPIDLSANSDWQRYRYKTFETMAPLRNMTWMGVQPGC